MIDAAARELVLQYVNNTKYANLRTRPQRSIIELCCGRDSRIGATIGEHSNDCLVARVTEDDDLTPERGLRKVIAFLQLFPGFPNFAVDCSPTCGRFCLLYWGTLAFWHRFYEGEACEALGRL